MNMRQTLSALLLTLAGSIGLLSGASQVRAQEVISYYAPAQPVITYRPERAGLFGWRTAWRPEVSYATTSSYYSPATTYYSSPTTTYYAPSTTTTYYAPSATSYYTPTRTYYAPSTTTYYSPSTTAYYAPSETVVTPRVTSYYAPSTPVITNYTEPLPYYNFVPGY